MSEKLKRGFTRKEKGFILANVGVLPTEEIAKKLGRSPEGIEDFITKQSGINPHKLEVDPNEVKIRLDLKESAEWTQLEKQFTEGELRVFQERYATLMGQFKGDVLPSEISQVMHLLKLEAMLDRNLEAQKVATEDIFRLRKFIHSWTADPEDDKLLSYNEQLTARLSSQDSYTSEFVKLSKEKNDLMKQLKATRDQRFAKVENIKTSFMDVIKELMDDEKRAKEGQQMELMRLAALKEKDRLSQLYTFADGQVDRPLLNSETVLLDDLSGAV